MIRNGNNKYHALQQPKPPKFHDELNLLLREIIIISHHFTPYGYQRNW